MVKGKRQRWTKQTESQKRTSEKEPNGFFTTEKNRTVEINNYHTIKNVSDHCSWHRALKTLRVSSDRSVFVMLMR